MDDLTGKRILITGAAKRVGRVLGLAFARAGADLVIHYGTSEADAITLQAEIKKLGRKAEFLKADLNNPVEVEGLIPEALKGGPLYGLVNNASIFASITWDQTTLEDWNRHLMINLTAPFLLSQAFARSLTGGAEGRIVNLVDWRALRPGADHLPYTISKAALAALTRSLAVALAPRITVNGLAFGAILPPTDGGDTKKPILAVPAGRWASMDEVEQAALFLMSGPAFITGEIIHLDGGRHLV